MLKQFYEHAVKITCKLVNNSSWKISKINRFYLINVSGHLSTSRHPEKAWRSPNTRAKRKSQCLFVVHNIWIV